LNGVWTARPEGKHRVFVNFSESAKNFINLPKTLARKNQSQLASRAYHGFFSRPLFEFPVKCCPPTEGQLTTFGNLLQPGDLLTKKVDVSGTTYKINNIVITEVECEDVIRIGVILGIVLRLDKLLFIVSSYDAIRTTFRFFEAIPRDVVELVDYRNLADFKPLFKRTHGDCFIFFLHHHLPTPLC
jgi:hypothetical protein